MNLSGLWLNICGRVHGAEAAAAADDSGRCPGCRILGVLRGDSLFSADGAAGIVWGWWLIGGASPRCVCVRVRGVVSFWRVVCDVGARCW